MSSYDEVSLISSCAGERRSLQDGVVPARVRHHRTDIASPDEDRANAGDDDRETQADT